MAKIRVLNSVGATVIINNVEQEKVTVDAGSTVTWSVSKTGYVTQSGSQEVWEDTVLPVTLKREVYTITFNVSPMDATLTVNGSAVALTDGKYTTTAKWGDTVSWSCGADGYVSQSGGFTADGDRTVDITLEEEVVEDPDRTIMFVVSPTDATLDVNGEHVILTRGTYTMTAHDGDVIDWLCDCDGYVVQSGSHTVSGDATITITLEAGVVEHYITVEPDALTFPSRGGGKAVVLRCNGDWLIESIPAYVELQNMGNGSLYDAGTTYTGDADVYVNVADNTTTSDIEHTITFRTADGSATATLHVTVEALEAEGEIYTLALEDTGTAPWSGDSNHIVRWSQPGCKKYLYELDASTTLGSVKSVTDIGDPYDGGEINGEIVLNIPADTATGDKTGTLTVRGYDENGDLVVTATVRLTQNGGPEIEYPTNVEGTDGTNFNVDSLALAGEREYTFRIRTSEYVEKVHISPIPAYGDHGYGYEYGISSVTLNGVTVGTSGGSVSVEGGKEYDVTVKFHNYHTHTNTGANPVTGAYYGCEYSIYFTPSYGEYTGSEQEFVIYTSNASSGPVELNSLSGGSDAQPTGDAEAYSEGEGNENENG